MKYLIDNIEYDFQKNYQSDNELRSSLQRLSQTVFDGLSFEEWYQAGYWDTNCIPYTLFKDGECVANIFVHIMHLMIQKEEKLYIQLGTVMSNPTYRGKGLMAFLMKEIKQDWKDTSDAMFLFANDNVLNFYPKFGFVEAFEYQYRTTVQATPGDVCKLDLENVDDKANLLDKIQCGNPFSDIVHQNRKAISMFHCMMFHRDHLYYLPDFDAVVIATIEAGVLQCYEIYCEVHYQMEDILATMADEQMQKVVLGFMPKHSEEYDTALYHEVDNHLFIMEDKEHPFKDKRLILPMLCHT